MLPKSKKGAELAFNVIIIAAIGLLVLAVVLFIFVGKSGKISEGLDDCSAKRGTCEFSGECAGAIISGTNCAEDFQPARICCVEI